MTRRFTAGVATGILIVGLAGVAAALRAGTTAAAGPSRASTATRTSSSQGGGLAIDQMEGAAVMAPFPAGALGLSGDAGAGVSTAIKGAIVTVTAVNGQTISATFGGLKSLVGFAGGPFMLKGAAGGPFLQIRPGTTDSSTPRLTINVTPATTFTRAGKTANLSDVQVGSVLAVQGTSTGNNTFTASAIEIVLPQRMGVVTAINGNNLTITGFDARTYTIAVSGDTTYRRAGQTAALSDIAVGSLISAEGTPSSDGATLNAQAMTIQLPRVAGQVTAVSDNTVTVQGPDGTTSRVLLTDATTYGAGPEAGATAGKSSITTGRLIMAEGTLGSDGTLIALHVDVATEGAFPTGKGMGFGPGFLPGLRSFAIRGGDTATSTSPSF